MTLFWQGVNLVILFGVLIYLTRRPIQQFFSDRRDEVKNDLDSAASVLSEAESRMAVDRLIDATARRGGKVHLAKDQVLTPEQFHRIYPRCRELLAMKRRLDPDGLFTSDLVRRVGLTLAPGAEQSKAEAPYPVVETSGAAVRNR